MAAAGYTPISLYYSTTLGVVPTASNLVLGELALNVTDGKLYYKDTVGAVYLLADKTTGSGNLPGGSAGAIAYQSSPSNTTFLPLATSGFILTAGTTTPTYTNPNAITVGNAVFAASAGNLSGGATNQIPYQISPSLTGFSSAPTTAGTVFSWNGTSFTWTNAPVATNVAGGAANQLVYQTAPGTTGFVAAPVTSGFVLGWNGTTFDWVNAPSATSAINLSGGNPGTVVYQTAPGVTAYAAAGANGQVFTYNTSTNKPEWTNPVVTIGDTAVAVNGAPTTVITGVTSITVTQDPVLELDLATKQYVDTVASTGIHIHPAVNADVDGNEAAVYVNGGTTLTVTAIAGNKTLTIASHGLSVEDQIVPATTANGLVAGTPYYVYSVVGPNEITISASVFGTQIITLVNGTGLSISLAANTGVGATLTSTGTGPLLSEKYIFALNDRALILGQTNPAENGVYTVTQVGVVGVSPWILTRATDADKYTPNSSTGLGGGDYFLVTGGTDAGEAYVCTNSGNIIFGTTAITFALFSSGGGSGGVSPSFVYFVGQL